MMKTYPQQSEISYYKLLEPDIKSQLKEMVVGNFYRTHHIEWVNVSEFDENWSQKRQYIVRDSLGKTPKNMVAARDFFAMCPITRHRLYGRTIMTAVKIDVRGIPEILNGRHRFCTLRDVYKLEAVPVSMDNESAKNGLNHGLILRNSREQSRPGTPWESPGKNSRFAYRKPDGPDGGRLPPS